jgi:hypothetical protein
MPLSVGAAQRLCVYCLMIMVNDVAVREQVAGVEADGNEPTVMTIIRSGIAATHQSAHTDIAVSPAPVFFESRAIHGGASNDEGGGGFRFRMFWV